MPAIVSEHAASEVRSPASSKSQQMPASSVTSVVARSQQQEHERHLKDKRSWEYNIRSGLAGGLAGCTAKTVVGPLDRVKILFQASSPQFEKYTGRWNGMAVAMMDIYRADGIRGLFRGHSATLLRIFPYSSIKFVVYEQARAVLIREKKQETLVRRFVAGATAGISSTFISYPLELIRVRLAFETKRDSRSSLVRICRQIYNERPRPPLPSPNSSGPASPGTIAATAVDAVRPSSGLANFYRGFFPTICGMLPYAGMSFLTHDTVGDWLRQPAIAQYTLLDPSSLQQMNPASSSPIDKPYSRPPLNWWAQLTAGAAAGVVSQTSSYPLEVIRRRMQVGGAVGDGKRLRIGETARMIMRERGWRGFFVGLTIGYIKMIPMTAVSFWTYERSKRLFGI